MLFTKGVEPMTEYEVAPGVRATKARRRAELAVRPQDFKSWQRAWEITVRGRGSPSGTAPSPTRPAAAAPPLAQVLAAISEQIDPSELLVGAYLTDKHSHGTVALRLELWFGTEDAAVCDAIAEELRLLLKAELPDLPFAFKPVVRSGGGKPAAGGAGEAAGAGGGGRGGRRY